MIPVFDPRTIVGTVSLLGLVSVGANTALSAHSMIIVVAILAFARAWKTTTVTIIVYLAAMMLVHWSQNLEGMLVIAVIMMSYLAQKILVFILLGTFMARHTTLEGIGAALEKLRLPRHIVLPTMVAMRFFPTLTHEVKALSDSLKTRGIATHRMWWAVHPIRAGELYVTPLFMRAIKTSDELAASALTRGLGMKQHPTILYPLRLGWADFALAVYTVAGASISLTLSFIAL